MGATEWRKKIGMSAVMRAIVCRDWCEYDDLTVTEIDRPEMRPGAVRVRIRYAGVSFATTLVVAGRYQRRPPLPFVPGTEITGEVLETGAGVDEFRVGDPVMAAIDWGGYGQETVPPPTLSRVSAKNRFDSKRHASTLS